VLQDIDRLHRSAANEKQAIERLPERLVTEPSREASAGSWEPLSTRIGGSGSGAEVPQSQEDTSDVFFPKPFNDDQMEISRRLSKADGLVVQGPPGTGKTHTIANLICHAMATGQRVLVVSRGEAALAVLKEQLPSEVQPLAISVLSNERQGLRQIESAIREIQSVVEGTQPENRRTTITRLEKELDGLQKRIQAIDHELDGIASAHLTKIGPRGESPAELAQRVVAEREAYRWFMDRPLRFASETGLADRDIAALADARRRCGDLIDHLHAKLPAPSDVADMDTVAEWHDDLIAAAQHGEAAGSGPARSLRVTAVNAGKAHALADILDDLARAHQAAANARWIEPFRRAFIQGERNPWCDRLRERIDEWTAFDAERAMLLKHSVELPAGLTDSTDGLNAVARAAGGQKLWPVITLGKGTAKALVSGIRLDGAPLKDGDQEGWLHVAAVIANVAREREIKARWDAFAREIGAPMGHNAKAVVDFAGKVLRICEDARGNADLLSAIVTDAFTMQTLAHDPGALYRPGQADAFGCGFRASCDGRTGPTQGLADVSGRRSNLRLGASTGRRGSGKTLCGCG
jgi:AAA domain